MSREIERKLATVEQVYRANQSKLETCFEMVDAERRGFQQYLENIASQANSMLSHYEAGQQVDKRQFYRFLESVNETVIQRTRKVQSQLEERMEANRALYLKKVRQYEEQQLLAKKEARKHV